MIASRLNMTAFAHMNRAERPHRYIVQVQNRYSSWPEYTLRTSSRFRAERRARQLRKRNLPVEVRPIGS